MARKASSAIFEMPELGKRANPKIVSTLKRCARAHMPVEIFYLSMNSSKENPRWRRVTPHVFVYDRFRWFMRAFCHHNFIYKDFVLARCLKTRPLNKADEIAKEDREWDQRVPLTLTANPKLAADQRKAIEFEFLSGKKRKILKVRRSLLPYVIKRIKLETAKSNGRRLMALQSVTGRPGKNKAK